MSEFGNFIPENVLSRNTLAEMPQLRGEKLIENLAPGKLPPELDLAISSAVAEKMSRTKY